MTDSGLHRRSRDDHNCFVSGVGDAAEIGKGFLSARQAADMKRTGKIIVSLILVCACKATAAMITSLDEAQSGDAAPAAGVRAMQPIDADPIRTLSGE